MKILKRLIWSVVVLIVLVVIGLLIVEPVVKGVVESRASDALGVKTTAVDLDLRMLAGECRLSGLKVENPEGFPADHFLTVEELELEVSPVSLLGDRIEMPRLRLQGFEMTLEQTARGGNYAVILDHLRKRRPKEEKGEAKEFVIDLVDIRDVHVRAVIVPPGAPPVDLDLTVPAIRLEKVGSAEKGVVLAQLAEQVILAVLEAISAEGGGIFPGGFRKELEESLARFPSVPFEVVGEVLGKAGEDMPGVEEKLEETQKKLEDRFGGAREQVEDLIERRSREGDEGTTKDER